MVVRKGLLLKLICPRAQFGEASLLQVLVPWCHPFSANKPGLGTRTSSNSRPIIETRPTCHRGPQLITREHSVRRPRRDLWLPRATRRRNHSRCPVGPVYYLT